MDPLSTKPQDIVPAHLLEKRTYPRVPAVLPCSLEFNGDSVYSGHTVDLGLGGVCVRSRALLDAQGKQPMIGRRGILTLEMKLGGASTSMRVKCRIAQMYANGIGLSVRFEDLAEVDLKTLTDLLDAHEAGP